MTGKSPGRPRDEKLLARRRCEILDAAAHVFARHGYQAADVQEIADRLKISKGTIYNYFPSKEELFLAAVDRGIEALTEHIDAVTAGIEDPLAQMTVAIEAYLDYFHRHPHLVDLLIQERAAFRDRRQWTYFQHRQQRTARWHGVIQGLVDAGRFRPMSPERFTGVLGDLVYGTMFTNHMAGRTRPHEDQTADILDVVFNGIFTDQERQRRETK